MVACVFAGSSSLDVDLVDVALVAVPLPQGVDGQHDVRELAALHDAADVPFRVQQGDGVSHASLGLVGVVIVDDHVVGPLERSAGEELEAAAHPGEFLVVDAGGAQRDAFGRDAEHPGGHFHVRLFGHVSHQLLGNRRRAQAENGRGFRPHQDVRADASRAFLRILDESVAEAHQAEDQRHRYADEQDTEQAAHRPVFEIF
jgi:hypothetical protein